MTINELLGKPVWQMTGEELLFLARHGNMSTNGETAKASSKEEKQYVYGLAGRVRRCPAWWDFHRRERAARVLYMSASRAGRRSSRRRGAVEDDALGCARVAALFYFDPPCDAEVSAGDSAVVSESE